jgi:hypothetical protein
MKEEKITEEVPKEDNKKDELTKKEKKKKKRELKNSNKIKKEKKEKGEQTTICKKYDNIDEFSNELENLLTLDHKVKLNNYKII